MGNTNPPKSTGFRNTVSADTGGFWLPVCSSHSTLRQWLQRLSQNFEIPVISTHLQQSACGPKCPLDLQQFLSPDDLQGLVKGHNARVREGTAYHHPQLGLIRLRQLEMQWAAKRSLRMADENWFVARYLFTPLAALKRA